MYWNIERDHVQINGTRHILSTMYFNVDNVACNISDNFSNTYDMFLETVLILSVF